MKVTGRPKKAPNKRTGTVRDNTCNIRCSDGFTRIMEAFLESGYKSKADVLHEALQLLAYKKLESTKGVQYWIQRI